ncbi:hypothetical protein [Parasphingorhabdus sp.]|uniref:hypothetical protein n=1 Tax=Parasphingorhabdus sp. TaxID=2709688 RepID=UPI003D2AAE8A
MMFAFRVLMVVLFVAISGYTAVTIASHGWNLAPVFFGDMAAMAWPGQFNFDFMCFLILSALWVSWRHQFSAAGLLLGAIASVGGMLFLSAYLFIVSGQAKGDVRELLLGKARAAQS